MNHYVLGTGEHCYKTIFYNFFFSLININRIFFFFPRGEAFIPFIDNLPSLNRKMDGPFIMPVVDKYKDMGTVVMGKVEAGEAKKGQVLLLMPNRVNKFLLVDRV